MSTRTSLRPQIVVNAVSMGADITSSPTILQSLSRVAYEVVWSGGGTPVGNLYLQVSNDYSLNPDGTVHNQGTWVSMDLTSGGLIVSSIAISGNSGQKFIEVGGTAAYAVRLFYDYTSGSATMTATVNGKVS